MKYGQLSKKQQKMLIAFYKKNHSNMYVQKDNNVRLYVDQDGIDDIFDVRQSEYFINAVERIIDDWDSEIGRDFNSDLVKQCLSESGRCSYERSESKPHGFCVDCGSDFDRFRERVLDNLSRIDIDDCGNGIVTDKKDNYETVSEYLRTVDDEVMELTQ